MLLKTDGGAATQQRVKDALSGYPNLKIQSRAEFEKSQEQQVNQLLGLVYALLALAVIIALIGIVNTLMLSVFERTHEIGLLRAVGMKRRQIRAMIRSESVILAVFGAIIGIVVGTLLGVALVSSLRSQGITNLVVPVSNLVVFLVLAALLGLLAASWPARRAARLDVLAAIAAEYLSATGIGVDRSDRRGRLEVGPGEVGREPADERLEPEGAAGRHVGPGLVGREDLVGARFCRQLVDGGGEGDRCRAACGPRSTRRSRARRSAGTRRSRPTPARGRRRRRR